jgi:hypothetical protein
MTFLLSQNTYAIALPPPDFGDQEERKYRRIVRETRGKDLIIFSKIGFPLLKSFDTYTYTFKFMTEVQKQDLINFLDNTVGQLITVTDYNDVIYNGLIITPSAEITNAARSNNEVTLEIEYVPF